MNQNFSFGRIIAATLIGLIGCVVIWVVVPYNNFAYHNSYISDSYLPEIVIALLLLLVLAANPLLRLIRPSLVLDRRQLSLICGLLLFAAVIPGNGLMRMFPRFVAEMNRDFNQNSHWGEIAAEAGFRDSLWPDPMPVLDEDGNAKPSDTPVSDQFIDELEPGNTVPWSAWVVPFATWGGLLLALWMMMLGLGGVVYPQWRERERLPFPLLNVYQSLTGSQDENGDNWLPALFRSPTFWTATGVVFGIHALRGLNVFTGSFPSFPLSWDLSPYFTEGILANAAGTLKKQHIFFSLVGVAYFVPNRYAISVWGTIVAFAIYATLGNAYIPAFNGGAQVQGLSFGALLAIAVWVLWLGRAHWVMVGRAMLGRASGGPESRRDSIAGWMFAIGCAAMVLWLNWAGCELWWSILATAGCAIVGLLMARIIAETGLPILWMNRLGIAGLAGLFPLTWQSPTTLLFSGVFYAIVTRASAVNAAVMATMALGVDKEASAKQQSRLLIGGLGVLVVGFIVCGAVHLNMGYHNSELATQAKTGARVVAEWDRVDRVEYNLFTAKHGTQLLGFVIGMGMLWACSRFVSWPFHPVGVLFCFFSIGNLIWFSIFLGWLVKVGVTSLLGGGAYRKARPVFLGLILGELLALIFWALVPLVIILATGADPTKIARYTLIRYP